MLLPGVFASRLVFEDCSPRAEEVGRPSKRLNLIGAIICRLICPTGFQPQFLSTPSRKNIPLLHSLKSALWSPPSRLDQRGVSRSSRTWSAGCGGRGGTQDEARETRTAKSCGPDASTPASSWRRRVPRLADDSDKKARSLGRARRKPLKPSRGECRIFRPTCGD